LPKYTNLVFEGGGVWGIAYEGALSELEATGAVDFQHLRRVGGASAGAITACLLAVGYTPAELGEVLRETKFKQFQDDSLGVARDAKRLLAEYGWHRGDKFKNWISAHIESKIKALAQKYNIKSPPLSPTFAQLEQFQARLAVHGHPLPALYVVGSNLSAQCREIYSGEAGHTPDLSIADAVRRSMSIPLFFACARGPASRGNRGDVIVDGGLTWNYPLNLFDHTKYLDDTKDGKDISYATTPGQVFNTRTLGFRLDTTKEVEWNFLDWKNEPLKINNILQYSWALVSFMRAIANKIHLHKNDWARTVFIDVGEEISFTDFGLSKAKQDFLVRAGREGVRKFLDWRGSPAGKKEVNAIYKDMAS
jgi:NTE family protein